MPGRQGVRTPDSDVRPLPEPDAAGDLSVADSIAECLDELHGLRPDRQAFCCVERRRRASPMLPERPAPGESPADKETETEEANSHGLLLPERAHRIDGRRPPRGERSEEHTSELQSPYVISYAVFCL